MTTAKQQTWEPKAATCAISLTYMILVGFWCLYIFILQLGIRPHSPWWSWWWHWQWLFMVLGLLSTLMQPRWLIRWKPVAALGLDLRMIESMRSGAFLTGFIPSVLVLAASLSWSWSDRSWLEPIRVAVLSNTRVQVGMIVVWLIFSCLCAIPVKRLLDTQDEAERQKANAALARDAALRARLAPHFIFNTLNTLHAQIERDPGSAQATTERLALLFRQVLEVSECPTVPLRQELAFVEGYLGIEQARLGERLQVVLEIPEELESAEIPPLSLQVLVENAIKHGVAPREEGGLVRISAARSATWLTLWVEDPGDGQSAGNGTGTALETLRSRLGAPEDLWLEPLPVGFRAAFRWRMA